jgi:hypothetical protein
MDSKPHCITFIFKTAYIIVEKIARTRHADTHPPKLKHIIG